MYPPQQRKQISTRLPDNPFSVSLSPAAPLLLPISGKHKNTAKGQYKNALSFCRVIEAEKRQKK